MSDRTRFFAARSPVHGQGLFAARCFRKDDWIGTFTGTPTTRDGQHVLWIWRDDGTVVGIRGKNELRFLNHSKRANAEFEGAELYATRKIEADAEILIDYGEDWGD